MRNPNSIARPGATYKHFKGGVYKVTALDQERESSQE